MIFLLSQSKSINMKFSDRIGATKVRDTFQIDSMDNRLSNRLWNEVYVFIRDADEIYKNIKEEGYFFYRDLWTVFFAFEIDEFPYNHAEDYISPVYLSTIKKWYKESSWFDKYNIIEFIANRASELCVGFLYTEPLYPDFIIECNKVLKQENSAYIFINGTLSPITTEIEVQEIEEAMNSSWQNVNIHLEKSLKLFSNRTKPDYRNSIKESISAVEAICIIISKSIGSKGDTLGKTLAILEQQFGLHPSLKKGFSSIYGYTSNEGGIRHALEEDSTEVTQEDAKFMLISCSAFSNYLKTKLQKIESDK